MTSANAPRFCSQLGCGGVERLLLSKVTSRKAFSSPARSNGPTGLSHLVYSSVLTFSVARKAHPPIASGFLFYAFDPSFSVAATAYGLAARYLFSNSSLVHIVFISVMR